MEAVPRLPMVYFQAKVSPEPTSFTSKIKQYIRDFYHEDPDSYNNEIHQLENLRAVAVRPPNSEEGCALLQKYYCQLHFLQSRFPMGKDGAAAVTFTWRDTYANMVCSLANIRFEIISILYNIGAAHTKLGSRTERTSPEGMKMACTHFQCAIWAFEQLKSSYPQPSGVDMPPDLMTFMHQLSLAQAQECILEKSMLDNRKSTIVVKVARQTVDYYAQALSTLEQGNIEESAVLDTVGSKVYKCWKRYVKFKKAYQMAVMQLYQGMAAEEQRKMGERVAFYNAALASLEEAQTLYANGKGIVGLTGSSEEKDTVIEALTFANDVIEGKRKAAQNENEYIYHEQVPDKDLLPVVTGASLVKGISFDVNDIEVSGPDIFARLVPMKVHEANSLYSEEKAKILRSIGAKIHESDEQLDMCLASLKLEHLNLWDLDSYNSNNGSLPLPEELAERCAAINAKPRAIQDLVDAMKRLSDTYQDVESMFKEIDALLTEEQNREKEYQEAMGKRPPTIVATDLTREAKKYKEAHAKASESNQALHRAMTLHVNNLRILSQPLADLMAHVPSPTQNDGKKNVNKGEKKMIKELKRILAKVDEMRKQRLELHAKLRESIAQDDLTRLLVTNVENERLDRLFDSQLSKHQAQINLTEQNLTAQENILSALTDAYAQTAESRKAVEEVLNRREYTISSLISSYDAYEDLLAKSSKGFEFYRKLEINVSKLLQRLKSTCKVQEEERIQILARNNPAALPTQQQAAPMPTTNGANASGLKLKDYLTANRALFNAPQSQYVTMISTDYSAKPESPLAGNKSTAEAAGVTNVAVSSAYGQPYNAYYNSSQYSQQPYDYRANVGSNQHYIKANETTDSAASKEAQIPVQNTGVYAGYPVQQSQTSTVDPHYSAMGYGQHPVSNPQYSVQGYSVPYTQTDANAQIGGYVNTAPHSQNFPAQSVNTNNKAHVSVANGNSDVFRGYSTGHSIPTTSNLSANQQYIPQGYTGKDPPGSMSSFTGTWTNTTSNIHTTYAVSTLTSPSGGTGTNQDISSYYDRNNRWPAVSQQSYGQQVLSNSSLQQQQQQQQQQHQPVTQQVPTNSSLQQQVLPGQSAQPQPVQSVQQHQLQQQQMPQPPIQQQQMPPSPVQQRQIPQPIVQQQQQMPQPTVQQQQMPQPPVPQQQMQQPIHQQSVDAHGYQSNVQAEQDARNYGTDQSKHPNQIQNYPSNIQNQSNAQNYGSTQMQSQQGYGGTMYANGSSTGQDQTNMSSMVWQGNYSYPSQPNYQDPSYQNYAHGYAAQSYGAATQSGTATSYPAGYSYDANNGTYQQYNANAGSMQMAQSNVQDSAIQQSQVQQMQQQGQPQLQQYAPHYTNATSNGNTSETLSTQYSNQAYPTNEHNQNYYSAPYGRQTQAHDPYTGDNENVAVYNQTYMQATNNSTTNTTKSTPDQADSGVKQNTSNVDLLSDLDITINHAPLVPEVQLAEVKLVPEPSKKGEIKPTEVSANTDDNAKANGSESSSLHDDENLQIVWDNWYTDVQPKRDPLGDPNVMQKFILDIEKYEKFVGSLLVKTLSGATTLDIRWKELQELMEREAKRQTTNKATANASKNRSSQCVSYDSSLVEQSSYINASCIKDVTQWTPVSFIVTQAPKHEEFNDFWTMVWEQESEVIVSLVTDLQLSGDIYWPVSDDKDLTIGDFTLSLKSRVNHATYIQRQILVIHSGKKSERSIVHMQFLKWPTTGYPNSPGPFLALATDVMSEQALRHSLLKPIIVHCLVGGFQSGLFLLATATVCNVRAGHGVLDVPLVFSSLLKFRKGLVDKDSLLFGYRMVLYHAQDTLMKRGILSSTRSTFECFEDSKKGRGARKLQHHPSDDFLQGLGTNLKHGVSQSSGLNVSSSNSPLNLDETEAEVKSVDPLSQLDPLWSIRKGP